jgi:hypothetical protein
MTIKHVDQYDDAVEELHETKDCFDEPGAFGWVYDLLAIAFLATLIGFFIRACFIIANWPFWGME